MKYKQNKRRIDPRYFMDELEDETRIDEGTLEDLSPEELFDLPELEVGGSVAKQIRDPKADSQARYGAAEALVKDMEVWRLEDLRDFIETQISEKEGRGPLGAV